MTGFEPATTTKLLSRVELLYHLYERCVIATIRKKHVPRFVRYTSEFCVYENSGSKLAANYTKEFLSVLAKTNVTEAGGGSSVPAITLNLRSEVPPSSGDLSDPFTHITSFIIQPALLFVKSIHNKFRLLNSCPTLSTLIAYISICLGVGTVCMVLELFTVHTIWLDYPYVCQYRDRLL